MKHRRKLVNVTIMLVVKVLFKLFEVMGRTKEELTVLQVLQPLIRFLPLSALALVSVNGKENG